MGGYASASGWRITTFNEITGEGYVRFVEGFRLVLRFEGGVDPRGGSVPGSVAYIVHLQCSFTPTYSYTTSTYIRYYNAMLHGVSNVFILLYLFLKNVCGDIYIYIYIYYLFIYFRTSGYSTIYKH